MNQHPKQDRKMRVQFLGEETEDHEGKQGWHIYIFPSGVIHSIPRSMIRNLFDHGDGTHTIELPSFQEKYCEPN